MTHKQFGWTDKFDGFVIGTKMITAKDEEGVILAPDLPADASMDFGTSGTLEEWVGNIETIMNRPGAEPHQFALCHSFASCLAELVGSSNWHGLPFVLSGKGGSGKSTIAKVALGIYGSPSLMERQASDQGATVNAIIKRVSVTGSLPLSLDELSGRKPEDILALAYALANGREKERMTSGGKFSTTGDIWFKNSFITTNDSLQQTIGGFSGNYQTEATQLRFFEVEIPPDYRTRVFSDLSTTFMENHMDHVYGHAGRVFIRFLMQNIAWVRAQLTKARNKYNPQSEEDNKERFYRDAVVTAMVAGKIATKLGLISFDVKGMTDWALDHVIKQRVSRKENNYHADEQLASFVASLQGKLIVTRMWDRPGTKEIPNEMMRGPAVGRLATEDKKMYISTKALNDWCKDNGTKSSVIRSELSKKAYLIPAKDGKPSDMVRLSAGTNLPSVPTRCYELDYVKMVDQLDPLKDMIAVT